MAITPKYDNENVTFGYLKEYLKQNIQTGTGENSGEYNISGNYSSPPVPPYYKDSLLIINKNIYICKQDRLVGQFSWEDWSLVTNGSPIDDFIENTYKTDLLEIQNQMDDMIQTFYQEIDPSVEWTTSLTKEKHVGDYWYNTTDNTQWRYNKIATTPISYKWEQVNIPTTVYDMIDKKKTIYTSKPAAYSKDDMWIIEETISDEDMPTGTKENPVVKGDWVFCISDNDHYDKNDWVKKDDKVNVQYLETHYYSSEIINEKFEVINSEVETAISKNKEDILLEVNTNYTTRESFDEVISDYDKEIETIHNEVETTTNTVSALSVEKDRIEGLVSSNTERLGQVTTQYDLLSQTLNGVTNTMSTKGGNNLLFNAYFSEYNGDRLLTFWEGKGTVVSKYNSKSRNALSLLNGSIKQSVQLVNGEYCLSFKYEKLIEVATLKVSINGKTFDLSKVEKNVENSFKYVDNLTSDSYIVEFICDIDNGFLIYEPMLNEGTDASLFTQNANETITDTVVIGKGIEVNASNINSKARFDADGIRGFNTNNGELSFYQTNEGLYGKKLETETIRSGDLIISTKSHHNFFAGL